MLKSKKKRKQDRSRPRFISPKKNKIKYSQAPVNTLIEDMKKLTNGFLRNGYFSLGDEGKIDSNRLFKDSDKLAKLIDKIKDKDDDHLSIYYTGKIYRYFRKFKRVNRSEQERSANKFIIYLEHEGENCYIPKKRIFFQAY